ncbi:TPA: hypothetical protein O7X39_004520 [Salmonella enterica]|nr:hypothetical protein [Salmonella enterica subsp. enterica serovar Ceyco]HDC2125860.1 hypothetical protein [Salmonella enterica]
MRHSVPFILDVDVASGLFDLTAEDFLEKKAVLDGLAGEYMWLNQC